MATKRRNRGRLLIVALVCICFLMPKVFADDQPQWGQRFTRNMVSSETGLADDFDPATGKNIKWVASLGTYTWSTPIVAQGRVLIGTNNERPRDQRHKGDRGVLFCLDEKDGSFLWQLVIPKLVPSLYRDWPRTGICSPATVEGNRLYIVSNRGQVLCLDLDGQANGNDGPYRDEGRLMVQGDSEPMEVTKTDADVIWLFDMFAEVGIHQHDAAHSSILLHGRFLYINTSNGLNSKHEGIPAPDAPSLIVLDKTTGRLVAREYEGIGPRTFHSTWSSPAVGEVDGRWLVFFCGGDGIVYAFEALESVPPKGKVEKLKRVWRFDPDPTAPKENVHEYIKNRVQSPSNIKSMPVFHNNRVYVTHGGDIWWGKHEAWLKCIDATKTGQITESGLIWSYDLSQHCCSTPAVYDGMVFVADCGKQVRCVDAKSSKEYWTHETKGDIWASTLVADGKVYVGTRRGDFWVLAASRKKKVISTVQLDSAMAGTPTAANGVLYIATMKKLYAVQKQVEQH